MVLDSNLIEIRFVSNVYKAQYGHTRSKLCTLNYLTKWQFESGFLTFKGNHKLHFMMILWLSNDYKNSVKSFKSCLKLVFRYFSMPFTSSKSCVTVATVLGNCKPSTEDRGVPTSFHIWSSPFQICSFPSKILCIMQPLNHSKKTQKNSHTTNIV